MQSMENEVGWPFWERSNLMEFIQKVFVNMAGMTRLKTNLCG